MSEDDTQAQHRGSGSSMYTRKAQATWEAPRRWATDRFFAPELETAKRLLTAGALDDLVATSVGPTLGDCA